MPPPFKRQRTVPRSPSPPLLPAHLTTLPAPPSSTAHAQLQVQAWEATLLPSTLQWEPGVGVPEEKVWKGRVRRAGDGDEIGEDEVEESEVRTDRYDILHLLPSRLTLPSSAASPNPDPRGFTHLPSLHEDLFHLTPSDRALVAHQERRRKMEKEREERVREVERLEREDKEREKLKGGEDEEPDPTQLSLMLRLSTTLSSSPNPSLLELRILANHSKDERFGFLREGGRWRSVWGEIRRGERRVDGRRKGNAEVEKVEEKKGIAGLVAYGSDSEEEDAVGQAVAQTQARANDADATPAEADSAPDPPAVSNDAGTADDADRRAKQAIKAEKAREWARKRREAREAAGASSESQWIEGC